jgi:hypothetical protein
MGPINFGQYDSHGNRVAGAQSPERESGGLLPLDGVVPDTTGKVQKITEIFPICDSL